MFGVVVELLERPVDLVSEEHGAEPVVAGRQPPRLIGRQRIPREESLIGRPRRVEPAPQSGARALLAYELAHRLKAVQVVAQCLIEVRECGA
jgi:hypothetical protein